MLEFEEGGLASIVVNERERVNLDDFGVNELLKPNAVGDENLVHFLAVKNFAALLACANEAP